MMKKKMMMEVPVQLIVVHPHSVILILLLMNDYENHQVLYLQVRPIKMLHLWDIHLTP